jgi:hypothetical protein
MSKTDGGPAFPHQKDLVLYNDADKREPAQTIRGVWDGGMSLRDYFAAKALAGVLATITDMTPASRNDTARIAADCYTMADAMLRAREGK